MLFFSDVEHYVPVKLCKTAGSIHSFKIIGHLIPAQITLKRRLLWDVVHIDWKDMLMTLNGNIVCLPTSVIIPMRNKFMLICIIRKRSLLLHIMLKQGTSWYALDSCLDDSENIIADHGK